MNVYNSCNRGKGWEKGEVRIIKPQCDEDHQSQKIITDIFIILVHVVENKRIR